MKEGGKRLCRRISPLTTRLIEGALAIGRHKTKQDAVTAALREYIRRRTQRRILGVVGKIEYDPEYDYKALRRQK